MNLMVMLALFKVIDINVNLRFIVALKIVIKIYILDNQRKCLT